MVAKAMAFGGNNKEQSLEALTNFQAKVLAKLQQKVLQQPPCFCPSFQRCVQCCMTSFVHAPCASPCMPISMRPTGPLPVCVCCACTFCPCQEIPQEHARTPPSLPVLQVKTFKSLQAGDLTALVESFIPTTAITPPVFFAGPTSPTEIEQSYSAVSFGFTGVGYSPCAIPITPVGVGIFPQGAQLLLSLTMTRFFLETKSTSWRCLVYQRPFAVFACGC